MTQRRKFLREWPTKFACFHLVAESKCNNDKRYGEYASPLVNIFHLVYRRLHIRIDVVFVFLTYKAFSSRDSRII